MPGYLHPDKLNSVQAVLAGRRRKPRAPTRGSLMENLAVRLAAERRSGRQ